VSERCPMCNHKTPDHSAHCRYRPEAIAYAPDERRPPTSAERYADLHLPNHEEEQHRAAYGRADADIRPTGERYYPLDRGIPDTAFAERDPPDIIGLIAEEDEDIGHEGSDLYGEGPAMTVTRALAEAQERGLNPKDLVGAVKTPLGLLPWSALVQVAGVFKVGADKYGAYNWRTPGQPVQHVTYVEAAFRHLAAYMDGQTIDPETGCNHLAHAACGLLILLDASAVGNAIDNRPTPGHAAEIMAIRREV
jgi:hypothetical protein